MTVGWGLRSLIRDDFIGGWVELRDGEDGGTGEERDRGFGFGGSEKVEGDSRGGIGGGLRKGGWREWVAVVVVVSSDGLWYWVWMGLWNGGLGII